MKKLVSDSPAENQGPPQLLFMKPRDVEELVSALASNMERLEALAQRRDEQLQALVRDLKEENQRLREELSQLRQHNEALVREIEEHIVSELTSPEREDVQRFRYTTLKGSLEKILEMLEQEPEQPPPPWWKFWAR